MIQADAPPERRGPRSPVGRLALAVAFLLVLALPGAFGAFATTTVNRNNSMAAAASFPTYPAAVIADGPQFYYRLEDAVGSLTVADSSGNGKTGVVSTTQYDKPPWTGVWPLDDGSGATASDLSGSATTNDLSLNGATWTASGRSRSGLAFSGAGQYASATTSTVTTTGKFTVSVWVYLTDKSTSRTALSQGGTNVSGFELGYDLSTDRWAFRMPWSDSAAATVDVTTSSAAPSLNTWTNLTATYDSTSAANNLILYVNGSKTSTTRSHSFAATGPLIVGAGYSGGLTHYWQGSLDNIRSDDGQVVSLQSAAEQTLGVTGGSDTMWNFDEGSGATISDMSGNLNTGTLVGAGRTTTQRVGPYALTLDGTSSQYVSGSAAVHTTGSFSVAAWVRLSAYGGAGTSGAVVSQVGAHTSGFALRYQAGHWVFATATADTATDTPDTAVSAATPAAAAWTHLVGVFDSAAGTLKIYVNGALSGSGTHTSTWDATGGLDVGRDLFTDAWTYGLNGYLDDVRVFRRALDQAEITAIDNYSGAGTTLGAPGALQGPQQGLSSATAMAFGQAPNSGSSQQRLARAIYNPTRYTNPATFTVECWFRTAGMWPAIMTGGTQHGQTLISFSLYATGNPVAGNAGDRRLYLDTGGHLVFSMDGASSAQTTGTYFDSAWHHVAATAGAADGLTIYVDGSPAATGTYTTPANVTGYWRWGGDTWSGTWLTDYYNPGLLDELAVYDKVLTAQQIAWHYHANH